MRALRTVLPKKIRARHRALQPLRALLAAASRAWAAWPAPRSCASCGESSCWLRVGLASCGARFRLRVGEEETVQNLAQLTRSCWRFQDITQIYADEMDEWSRERLSEASSALCAHHEAQLEALRQEHSTVLLSMRQQHEAQLAVLARRAHGSTDAGAVDDGACKHETRSAAQQAVLCEHIRERIRSKLARRPAVVGTATASGCDVRKGMEAKVVHARHAGAG